MFNIKLFQSAFSTLTAKAEDKPQAIAAFLSSNLSQAAQSFLIDGSDSLNQVLGILKAGGKSSFAVKSRKVINSLEFSGFAAYGTLQGFGFVTKPKWTETNKDGFIGGNSSRVNDAEKAARVAACEAYGDAITACAAKVFAPAVRDVDKAVDPLEGYGKYSLNTIATKLASANINQLAEALERVSTLSGMIQAAHNAAEKAAQIEAEAVKAEAEKAAQIEAEAVKAEAEKAAQIEAVKAEAEKAAQIEAAKLEAAEKLEAAKPKTTIRAPKKAAQDNRMAA